MSTLTIINNESTGACYSVSFYAQNGAPVNTWYEITYIDVYGAQQTTGFAAGQDANGIPQSVSDYVGNGGRTVCAIVESVVTGGNCSSGYLGNCL